MLSAAIVEMLNEQINLEFYSSNLYLQMGAWCDQEGLEGSAAFLTGHAEEERSHMTRLWAYVSESGALPKLGAIGEPAYEFESIKDLFDQVFEHECHVTSRINALVQAAFDEKDMTTFNFLQWYISEQHEEEALFRSILDKIKVIGLEGKGLYFIDQELSKLAEQAAAESAAPAVA
ncbi:MAG: non-heme ferritin [Rhodospirillales bacterium]|nr:non-heme ferritin [Rhodospirillales bacterium]